MATEGQLSWSVVKSAAIETAKDLPNPASSLNKAKKVAKLYSNLKTKKMEIEVDGKVYTEGAKSTRKSGAHTFNGVSQNDKKTIVDTLTENSTKLKKVEGKKGGTIQPYVKDGNKITVRTESSSSEKIGDHLTIDIKAEGVKRGKTEIKLLD